MRRPLTVAALAGSLLLACSEQPTEAPSTPSAPAPSLEIGPPACTLNSLIDKARLLFPSIPTLNGVTAILRALPDKPQLRTSPLVRTAVFGVIDLTIKAYKAGKLAGTQANFLSFLDGLYCFVGLPAPSIPTGALDPNEGAIAVILPTSGNTLVRPNSKHGGVFIPARSVMEPTVVTVNLVNPFPLLTSLNQYPLFYEFKSSPEVTFTNLVTAAVCLDNRLSVPQGRLAHNVAPFRFGSVEILPPPVPPNPSPDAVVDCTNIPGPISSRWGVRGLFASVFLPGELNAATVALTTAAVGGTTRHFSPFGTVDPGSNPGILSIVKQNGNPTSGSVSGSGTDTVYVKTTSENGAPINSVPVNFGGTTRFTGANGNGAGIASFDWSVATPTASLTATVPNEAVEGENPCPIFGSDADPYRPRVCFTPSSVTFTRPGYAYRFVGTADTGVVAVAQADTTGWTTPGFANFSSWQTSSNSPLPFGDADIFGSCGYDDPVTLPVTKAWRPSTRNSPYQPVDVATSAASGLLLRQYVTVPTGATTLKINVAIDNDIAVFLNGTQLVEGTGVTFSHPSSSGWDPLPTGGFFTHGGCASANSGTFTVAVSTRLFTAGQPNLVAVNGRDRGGATYLDLTFPTSP